MFVQFVMSLHYSTMSLHGSRMTLFCSRMSRHGPNDHPRFQMSFHGYTNEKPWFQNEPPRLQNEFLLFPNEPPRFQKRASTVSERASTVLKESPRLQNDRMSLYGSEIILHAIKMSPRFQTEPLLFRNECSRFREN
jgi:hypothetical protein